jgi:hypothetical protein
MRRSLKRKSYSLVCITDKNVSKVVKKKKPVSDCVNSPNARGANSDLTHITAKILLLFHIHSTFREY